MNAVSRAEEIEIRHPNHHRAVRCRIGQLGRGRARCCRSIRAAWLGAPYLCRGVFTVEKHIRGNGSAAAVNA